MENDKEIVVPYGNTPEDMKARQEIIIGFYEGWKERNPSQMVYNRNLRENILVRHISVIETARHASKRYLSTLAVLQLDAILSNARKISYEKVESRKNQQSFKAMMVMQYDCPGIGMVKLTVGVKHKSLLKVQYCITAIEA